MKVQNDIIMYIDYLVNAIGNGKYLYYQISYIPAEKLEDKAFIDRLETKISEKYQTNKTKSERLNLRRKDKARFLAIRYKNILIILRTEGEFINGQKEKWEDIRNKKLELKLTEHTSYLVGLGESKKIKNNSKTLTAKVTVTLGKDTYNLIKLSCLEAIKEKKSIQLLLFEWNKINGFNGWRGINKQKQQLKEYLVKEVCINMGKNKRESQKLFRINTFKAKSLKGNKEVANV